MGSIGKRVGAHGRIIVGTLALGAGSAAMVPDAGARTSGQDTLALASPMPAPQDQTRSAALPYGLGVHASEGGDAWVVGRVVPGSVAAERGIRPGNEIVSVHGIRMSDGHTVHQAIAAAASEGRFAALVQLRTGSGWRLVTLPVQPS